MKYVLRYHASFNFVYSQAITFFWLGRSLSTTQLMDDVWDDDDNEGLGPIGVSPIEPFQKDLEKLEEIHSNVTSAQIRINKTGRLQGRNSSGTIQVCTRWIRCWIPQGSRLCDRIRQKFGQNDGPRTVTAWDGVEG